MKLHANIDDMALIVKDLLPRDLFLQVADFDFASVKDKKRQDSLIDWPRELYVDDTPENNRTMESVKTVINHAVCLKGEYEFVDPIFKEVLETIKRMTRRKKKKGVDYSKVFDDEETINRIRADINKRFITPDSFNNKKQIKNKKDL